MQVNGPDGNHDAGVANAFATALNRYLTQTSVNAYQAQVTQVEGRLSALQSQINQYQGLTDPVSQAKLGSAEDQYRLAYDSFQQLAAQGQPGAAFNVLQTAVPVPSGGSSPPQSRLERALIAGRSGCSSASPSPSDSSCFGLGSTTRPTPSASPGQWCWPKCPDSRGPNCGATTLGTLRVPGWPPSERRTACCGPPFC